MRYFWFFTLFFILFPLPVFAAPAEPTLLDHFQDQHWFQIATQVVAVCSVIAAALPDSLKTKPDGSERTWYLWFHGIIEFLASNVFHAKSKEQGDKGVN